MSDAEKELRSIWTEQGVSEQRQNEILQEIRMKAQPGAQVGPFKGKHQRYHLKRVQLAPYLARSWPDTPMEATPPYGWQGDLECVPTPMQAMLPD